VCIYQAATNNLTGPPCVFNTSGTSAICDTTGRTGFGLRAESIGSGPYSVWGTWAATG
jgi:hypothetical protein